MISTAIKICSDVKSKTPWWLKIPLKITLSRLPLKYVTWSKMGYFKHGHMKKPEYAYNIFKHHYESVQSHVNLKDFSVLELGPGDSLSTAIVARAFGARECHLVDTAFFANTDIQIYHEMIRFISTKHPVLPDITGCQNVHEILSECNSRYWTEGLESLKKLPDKSIDFIFSQAVLEHIRKDDFVKTLKQLRRIIKDNGICSHAIDLKDHLGGNLNSLRFSEKLWESEFFAKSGFYTNRIRYHTMLDLFRESGFNPQCVCPRYWQALPTSKDTLSEEFRCLSDEELRISEFDVVLSA